MFKRTTVEFQLIFYSLTKILFNELVIHFSSEISDSRKVKLVQVYLGLRGYKLSHSPFIRRLSKMYGKIKMMFKSFCLTLPQSQILKT